MTEGNGSGISPEEMSRIREEALDFAGIGLYRYRFDGTVVFMDRGALKLLDLEEAFPDPADAAGRQIGDLIVYEGPKGFLRSEIRRLGHVRDLRYPFSTLTGLKRWALHDSYLTTDPDTGEEMIQVIIRDITALRAVEEALEAERERLAVTLRSIGDGVISTDTESRIVLLNREAERLTGWTQEEAVGRRLSEIFRIVNERTRETVPNPVDRVITDGRVVGLANHTILISRDGVERAIADSGAPIFDSRSRIIGVVLVFRDAESERQAEEARLRIDRLESLGILAGGIAHDFNNFLTAILGNLSMARIALERDGIGGRIPEMLREAEDSTVRATSLTDQLLTFAKGGIPVKSVLQLPELIRNCAEFALSGSPVSLELDIAPDLRPVEADPGQLGRVLDNLVINAKQAMPDGGVLLVSADNVAIEAGASDGLRPGDFVRIRVTDEGTGIHPRFLGRVFDPYFTTKQKGSGLGLSTVYSIVTRHDGTVLVDSTPGRGTTFTVLLPAADRPAHGAAAATPTGRLRPSRILVMDDQESVLRTASRMLGTMGHDVTCAEDGEAAVSACRRALDAGTPFDLVILDLTVPGGMGGVETLDALRRFWPGVRAVASSGYSTDAVLADPASYGFAGILRKPYTVEDLARCLRRALEGSAE